jgi:hypothetical protein
MYSYLFRRLSSAQQHHTRSLSDKATISRHRPLLIVHILPTTKSSITPIQHGHLDVSTATTLPQDSATWYPRRTMRLRYISATRSSRRR